MKKKTKRHSSPEWFTSLVEEIEASVTESKYASTEIIIVGKHSIGESIMKTAGEQEVTESELIGLVAERSGVTKRTIQQCVQFYRTDPKLDCLKKGKNISWRKILNSMQVPKEKTEKEVEIEHLWFGKALSECTKKQLMEAVKHLVYQINHNHRSVEVDKIIK